MRKGFGGSAATLISLVVATVPSLALADGLEFAGAGARGTMRGGAYVVGSDDAMALLYNPANLAAVHGMQLHASLGLLFYSSCFQRDGTYGSSPNGTNRGGASDLADPYGGGRVDTSAETGLVDTNGNPISFDDIRDVRNPQVCNDHKVNFVPEIAYAWRISDRIGLGLGVVAPSAPGNLSFGDTIGGRAGMVRTNGMVLPSPGRYMLVDQAALIAFPTVGLGVQLAERVRIGASFGWGFGNIKYNTVAVPYFSENIATDIYAKVSVSDYFIPRVGAGFSAGPWAGFSVGANFTYYGDINGSGSLHASSMYYADPAVRAGVFRTEQTINDISLQTSLPWQVVGGVRYASQRVDFELPEGAVGDSLDTERWNVELNVGFTRSSRVKNFNVGLHDVAVPQLADGSGPDLAQYPCGNSAANYTNPEQTRGRPCINLDPGLIAGVPLQFPAPVRHNWKDQIFFRVGGDYNVVPGHLSLSAGVSYDSNGQQRGYEQLDFQPYRRVGAHVGFTARINRWDIFVAYAHHFNQRRTVTGTTACTGTVIRGSDMNGDGDRFDNGEQDTCDAPPPNGDPTDSSDTDWGLHPLAAVGLYNGDVANSGRFRSHLDVLQIGATYHFR